MTNSIEDKTWGFHLNETIYSLICPPCPKWANSWEKENWHKIGVVVWDARIQRVTHLHGDQAFQLLEHLRQFDTWQKDGLLVGEVAYRITIPSNKKSKKISVDQPEDKPISNDGWCLTHTIQLSPDQAKQFLLFLEREEISLPKVIETEEAERKRILGQAYSMILSWGKQREQSSSSIKKSITKKSVSVPRSAVTIPRGKYHTIAQVADICGVKENIVNSWLKKGLLKSLDLPKLGKLIEEKELAKYLAEK